MHWKKKDTNVYYHHKKGLTLYPYSTFFSLNNNKIKTYDNALEMLNFNSKKLSLKHPFSIRWNRYFSANISDFYRQFITKN